MGKPLPKEEKAPLDSARQVEPLEEKKLFLSYVSVITLRPLHHGCTGQAARSAMRSQPAWQQHEQQHQQQQKQQHKQ